MDTKELVEGLRRGDSGIIQSIYEDSFKYCASMVTNNSGQLEDARDLFQEAIMVLFRQVQKEEFTLTCTPKTYLYSVMRNLWLKRLHRSKKGSTIALDDDNKSWIDISAETAIEQQEQEKKYGIVDQAIRLIKEDCQALLKQFYFGKKDLKSIAVEMNYTYQFIKVKKNRCMKALKNKVAELRVE